jgi:predicted Zn-dependent protease with MMP-like domain
MERGEFVTLVEQAVESLPEEFKKRLDNVALVVEDWPTEEQLGRLQISGTLFGLYEGIPQTKRGTGYSGVLPDKITIFQKPIEQYAQDQKEMIRQIQQTVEHEIGHHFGLSETEARRRDKRKKDILER